MEIEKQYRCVDCDSPILRWTGVQEDGTLIYGDGFCLNCGRVYDGTVRDMNETYLTTPDAPTLTDAMLKDHCLRAIEHKPG